MVHSPIQRFGRTIPGTGLGDGGRCLRSLITCIGENAFDEGERTAGTLIEYPSHTIAVLHIGGMDDNVQEQAERINQNVSLATRNLLAGVKALWVERGAPF
jgi:hypothetical protein